MKRLITIIGQMSTHAVATVFRHDPDGRWGWIDFNDWRYCDIPKFKQWLEDQLK